MTRKRRSTAALLGVLDRQSIPEPNSGCFLWLGASKAAGYGHLNDGERYVGAHRLAYELNVGAIPDGHVVRHRCDTPQCINPAHLECGTVWDNTHDTIRRGRARRGRFPGEANPSAKLTVADVAIIRASPRFYGSRTELAKRFNCTTAQIGNILAGRAWHGA